VAAARVAAMTEGQGPPPPPSEPPAQPPPPPPGYQPPEAAPPAGPTGRYPVGYEVDYVRERSRLTTFFRIILAIPWIIVAYLYEIVGFVLAIVAWIVVVIIGRYPQTLYEWNSGILRFFTSLGGFVYLATDAWPPFGWNQSPTQPQRLLIASPAERQSRLKVFFRLILAIPVLIIAYPLNYLANATAVASWLTIVFRGYQPEWLQNVTVFALKWHARAGGYLLLLTDIYPPVGEDAPTLAAATA